MDLTKYSTEELKYVLKNPDGPGSRPLEKSILPVSFDPKSDRIQSLYDIDPNEVFQEFRKREKAIYGDDERIEAIESSPVLQESGRAVCAIVHYQSISDYGNGHSTLHARSYKDEYNLCPTERFLNQLVPAIGTAFLVDYSIVVTAAHCIDENSLREYKFVFGFETVVDGSTRTVIQNDQIYQGIKILDRRYEKSLGIDWAVIQLDRPVLDKPFLRLNFTDKIDIGQNVYCIGHPCGLPKKIALNGIVSEDNPYYFVANIDTYGGNSGSPVFNNDTNLVEGILVRGETDFLEQGDCNVSHRCLSDNCNGEEIFKPKDFHFLIPSSERPGSEFDNSKIDVKGSAIHLSNGVVLDFKGKEDKIEKAITTIKNYNFNFYGTVSTNPANMNYFLSNGIAPLGNMQDGEDKIAFNRNKIEVRRIGSRWKIVETNHWILDFGDSQEDARQAFSIILQHQFNYICFVGRPNPPLVYFKR
jgi:hypothetical protein